MKGCCTISSSLAPMPPTPNPPRNDRTSFFFSVGNLWAMVEEKEEHTMMPHQVLSGFFGGCRDDCFHNFSLLQRGKLWLFLWDAGSEPHEGFLQRILTGAHTDPINTRPTLWEAPHKHEEAIPTPDTSHLNQSFLSESWEGRNLTTFFFSW